MKKWLIFALVVAAALLVALWPRQPASTPDTISGETAPQTAAPTKPVRDQPRGAERSRAAAAQAGIQDTGTLESPEARAALEEAHNPPVEFYGVVIDQDSNALQGVTVDLEV